MESKRTFVEDDLSGAFVACTSRTGSPPEEEN